MSRAKFSLASRPLAASRSPSATPMRKVEQLVVEGVEEQEVVGVEAKATQGGAKKQNKRREEGAIGQRGTGGRR